MTLRPFVLPAIFAAVFLLAYLVPFEAVPERAGAVREALLMLQDYARHHVLLCLVPALFLAGGVSVFVSQAAVMRYFGAAARKSVAYAVASVSGTILAACSCTVLPLFAGIYRRGAGLGPACTFLYSGPAINVLAILLTMRVLGWELGVARALLAVGFSVLIGLAMHLIYRTEEAARGEAAGFDLPVEARLRPLWQDGLYFSAMIGFLVFANWSRISESGFAAAVWSVKWILAGLSLAVLAAALTLWFGRAEIRAWMAATWTLTRQILPLLFAGILVAGLLLGRPEQEGLIPGEWIAGAVGGEGLGANLIASVAGALMYFATLTEVPIVQGLLGAGMGHGPALALLLAGPALSLPSLLVIRQVMGTRKTLVFIALVIAFSTVAGLVYGALRGGPA